LSSKFLLIIKTAWHAIYVIIFQSMCRYLTSMIFSFLMSKVFFLQ
jgi:hypothetical protein